MLSLSHRALRGQAGVTHAGDAGSSCVITPLRITPLLPRVVPPLKLRITPLLPKLISAATLNTKASC